MKKELTRAELTVKNREYWKRRREKAKEANLCSLCLKREATESYTTCEECRLYQNQRRISYRNKNIENGNCIVCFKPNDRVGESITCSLCYEKQITGTQGEKHKLRYQKRIEKVKSFKFDPTKCNTCGGENDTGQFRCSKCRQRTREQSLMLRRERAEKGVCLRCGGEKLPNSRLCQKHWFCDSADGNLGSSKRWKELEELWFKQKGLCYYSGVPLILGINASVDHKLPTCRFFDNRFDIDNLVFCDMAVNQMKRDCTDDEFIKLCHAVAKRHPM